MTAAAEATLAVQHAATEDLLRVAHAHRGVLRPGVLSQALLRMAKVCADPSRVPGVVEVGVERGSVYEDVRESTARKLATAVHPAVVSYLLYHVIYQAPAPGTCYLGAS